MAIGWRKVAKIGTSIIDQAWLSGISLLISLIFARELGKEEFGLYILLFNTSLLFQGIGGALLAAPYTTLFPRKQGREQAVVVDIFTRGTLVFAAAAALVAFIGYTLYGVASQDSLMTTAAGVGFAACILGSISKDNVRVFHYSRNNPTAALKNNFLYGGLLIGVIIVMIQTRQVSAAGVLLTIGVCSAIVSVPRLFQPQPRPDPHTVFSTGPTGEPAAKRTVLGEFWGCGRWAALGSLVTFLTSNTYPYLAALSFSKSEVADITVARLLSMPIALIGAAWFNLMRSRLSQWAAEHQYARLDTTIRNSVLAVTALTVLVGLLLGASSSLIPVLFGAKYANLQFLTLVWTAQSGLAVIKGIYAATLMTGDAGYKDLSHIGIITLAATCVLMLAASATPYPEAIVLALVLLELFQIILIRRKRQQMQELRCQVSN